MRTEYTVSTCPSRSWIVVNTHPHREAWAVENLQRQRFETYCPLLRRQIRSARQVREVRRPLFPGYVFVAAGSIEDNWRPISSTYGVRRILRCGDGPGLLDHEFVTALRAREIDGVIARPHERFKIGQDVRVIEGPFEGIVTKIIDLVEGDRLVVLLDLLGKPVRATLESATVAAW